MNKKEARKLNRQTRSLNKRNERKLGYKISELTKEEIAIDHVMADVNEQRRQDSEMPFREEEQ